MNQDRALRASSVSAVAAVLLAACAPSSANTGDPDAATSASVVGPSPGESVPDSPTVTPRPSADPQVSQLSDTQWADIVRVGAWRPGCPVGQAQLRRIDINHYDFSGQVQRGVLVVNADVVPGVVRIFTALFEEKFPIRLMRPVEEYDGDSTASLAADNTSAYNCRRLSQINAPVLESPHANGRAIDMNPYENPWMDLRCDCWQPATEFGTNRTGPGVITEGSLPWQLFTQEGWIWQDIDTPDYMHFDTGYPSQPLPPPTGANP